MYCRHCGNELQEGQKFCPKCGTPIPRANETITSQETQSMSGDNAGKHVLQDNSNANISTTETIPLKKNNTKMIIAIIAAVAIVAVVIIAVVVMRSGNSTGQIAGIEESVDETEKEASEREENEVEIVEEEMAEGENSAISNSFDNVTVSDIIVEDITCATGSYNMYGHVAQGQRASGTIRNDTDETCTVTIEYEYEGTYYDSYDDSHIITEYDAIEYNVPANSTYTISTILTANQEIRYKTDDQLHTIEFTEYTGNTTYSVSSYSGPEYEKILPADSATNIEQSRMETQIGTAHVEFTVTVPNTTDDRWERCTVQMQVFYGDIYIDTVQGSADYIKPGEEAVMSDHLEMPYFDNDKDINERINNYSVIVTDIEYTMDTDESDV